MLTNLESGILKTRQIHNLKIKDLSKEDRPREKLLAQGAANLTNAELMGIIIGSGNDKMSAVDLARKILSHYEDDLSALSRSSVKELQRFRGIGEAKAISIISAIEFGKRKMSTKKVSKQCLGNSKNVFDLMYPELTDKIVEEFWVVMLNNANRLLKRQLVSTGGMCSTIADSRIVFKFALENNATKIVLVHNHPSGDIEPSKQDLEITKKLRIAGESLDIAVMDHVIISGDAYFSFLDSGLI